MFSIGKDSMYSVGYATVILYMISLTFYILALILPDFTKAGMILGTLFLVAASIIIGVMVKKRIGT